jgi:hypothetical protein
VKGRQTRRFCRPRRAPLTPNPYDWPASGGSDLKASLAVDVAIEDCRVAGAPISLSFIGNLRPDQETAVDALSPHDTGVARQSWPFA